MAPGCFATWAQLCEQLRATFIPTNYDYRQRSCFVACNQDKRELHENVLVGNHLPEHTKETVFMDDLSVDPSRTQSFRAQASAMERMIPRNTSIDRHALLPLCGRVSAYQRAGLKGLYGGTSTGPVPMELVTTVQSSIRYFDALALRVGKKAPFQTPWIEGSQTKPGPENQWNGGY
ncbi:Gag protein [Phytophthora palmivora]|uniref:Gag protein n=1 Tax=Phytophthora palmivora TaxID=4796 RepID=A0A2P4YMF0_9STRA|nr:Gag protein [Phytophthora palmivora]